MISRSDRRAGAFAAAALAIALAAAPAAAQTPAACPTPSATPNPVPVHVRAPAAVLDLRVAETYAAREYGLMCVRSMPATAGMIFAFSGGDSRQAFWMKNTLIPLDMVFVLRNGRVNNVDANVPATAVGTPDERLPDYDGTGSYVIELNAGEAARAGIVPGTHLDLSAVPPATE
jgi:uncharacterized membrane protein (UPF0127 family)